MRYKDLFEYEKRGDITHTIKYDILYHLTDYEGMTKIIFENALTAFRQSFISTTYDINNNNITGRNFHRFKFVLKGKELAEKYGAFENRAFINVIGQGYEDLNEREIGINTPSIEPFSEYSDTLYILEDMFSRSFAQWLFYKNRNKQGRGVAAIKKWLKDGKKLFVQDSSGVRQLTDKERDYLSFAIKLYNSPNISYPTALDHLVKKFQIKDSHNYMDDNQVSREKKLPQIERILHSTLTTKPYMKIKSEDVEKMWVRIMDILSISSNMKGEILHQLKSRNLFDPLIEPVQWSSLITDLIKNTDIEEMITGMEHIQKELKGKKSFNYEPDDFMYKIQQRQKHNKTGFAGIGDGY